MFSWQGTAGVSAALLVVVLLSACAGSAGSGSADPAADPASVSATAGEGCDGAPMDVRHAAYWYTRAASDLEGVVLPQPDCIRTSGRSGEVTLVWQQSDPGFLLTVASAFDIAGWNETTTTGDVLSFESARGTSVSASSVRFDYDESLDPYVALVYLRTDVPAAPGTPGWEH